MADIVNAIEMIGVKKSFGGLHALKEVNFVVTSGTCHGLIGENGAGKSTLMKVLGGTVHKDEGTVIVNGKEVNIRNKHMSQELGIAFVPQELDFISNFTVAENIYLGNEPLNGLGIIDKKKLYSDTKQLLDELRINLNPYKRAGDLNVSQQQMMIIAQALAHNANIIIMDEPTARLGHEEIEHLLSYISFLKQAGKTIIFISHHLEEVKRVADMVTVMRDGTTILTTETSKVSVPDLIKAMVNRDVSGQFVEETGHNISDLMLSVSDLKLTKKNNGISFEVHKGEIIGFFGLVGSGRTEMIRSLLKIDKQYNSKIVLDGKTVKFRNYKDAINSGIVLVPEERRKQGVILSSSISDNISLGQLDRFTRYFFINRRKEKQCTKCSAEAMNIICQSIDQKVNTLSGGNQQKVVLAKHVESDIKVFILDEPTSISSEIPELQRLCDTIYVMRQGVITKRFERKEIGNSDLLLQCALTN